ncbi:hypothetical protein JCM11251_004572 [Rhodosporidiobolus azoricus]
MPALIHSPIPYQRLLDALQDLDSYLATTGFHRDHHQDMAAAFLSFEHGVRNLIPDESHWRELALVRYHGAGPGRKDAPTFQRAAFNAVKSLGFGQDRNRHTIFQVTTAREVQQGKESFVRLMEQARLALEQLTPEDRAHGAEQVAQAEEAEQVSTVGFSPISRPAQASLDTFFPSAPSFRRAHTMRSLPSSGHALSISAQRRYGVDQADFAARWA